MCSDEAHGCPEVLHRLIEERFLHVCENEHEILDSFLTKRSSNMNYAIIDLWIGKIWPEGFYNTIFFYAHSLFHEFLYSELKTEVQTYL